MEAYTAAIEDLCFFQHAEGERDRLIGSLVEKVASDLEKCSEAEKDMLFSFLETQYSAFEVGNLEPQRGFWVWFKENLAREIEKFVAATDSEPEIERLIEIVEKLSVSQAAELMPPPFRSWTQKVKEILLKTRLFKHRYKAAPSERKNSI